MMGLCNRIANAFGLPTQNLLSMPVTELSQEPSAHS
jgi:hypothetical protein